MKLIVKKVNAARDLISKKSSCNNMQNDGDY